MLINELAARVHEANKKWWVDINTGEPIERNKGEMIALMHSELGEMTEAIRKDLTDDHLPQYPGEQVELIDCLIRTLDYIAGTGIEIMGNLSIDALLLRASGDCQMPENKLAGVAMIHFALSDLHYLEAQKSRKREIEDAAENVLLAIFMYAYRHDFADARLLDIFEAKMQYNANRADHKLENRRKAGGKKV